MRFNPDPKKQAQEVIFSRKISKIDHTPLYFSENLVKSSSTQKHQRSSKQYQEQPTRYQEQPTSTSAYLFAGDEVAEAIQV